MSYRIIDLCRNKILSNLKVLTSYNLNVPIRWINVVELSPTWPQLEDSIKNNDLIIVLGPFLNNNPDMLKSLLDLCIKKHAAAILLYPECLENGIPTPILTHAKNNEFPILEIGQTKENAPAISNLTSVILKEISTKNFLSPKFFSQNILQDIMDRDFYGDPLLFYANASSLGFNLQIPLQAVIVSAKRIVKNKNKQTVVAANEQRRLITEELPATVDNELSHYYFNQNYLSGVIRDKYTLLLPDSTTNYPIKKIGKLILEACMKLENSDQYSFYISIGSIGETLEDFSNSIHEAIQILDIMKITNAKNDVKHINDVILSMIVKNLQNDRFFIRLYETCILPLIEMDKAEKFDLLKSLITYFDNDKNISSAANELFLHRNTMKNRLEKIEELLSKDLDDPFDCLELQLALHYYRINYTS